MRLYDDGLGAGHDGRTAMTDWAINNTNNIFAGETYDTDLYVCPRTFQVRELRDGASLRTYGITAYSTNSNSEDGIHDTGRGLVRITLGSNESKAFTRSIYSSNDHAYEAPNDWNALSRGNTAASLTRHVWGIVS